MCLTLVIFLKAVFFFVLISLVIKVNWFMVVLFTYEFVNIALVRVAQVSWRQLDLRNSPNHVEAALPPVYYTLVF